MQNEIKVFESNEFGKLEVLTINNKPYFPAVEYAEVLGYKKPHDAVSRHCGDSVKHGVTDAIGRKQGKIFIPESDLYRLIIRSKLPAAVRFEKWVMDEVLPSIRQYGAYITDDVLDRLIENPEAAARLFAKLKDERAEKEALAERVEKLTPKARYYDIILSCPGAVLTTLIAKDYGMSAIKFNSLLHALGVQYRYTTNPTWYLYQKHENRGYTNSKTYDINGKAVTHMRWTQKGRFWLYEYLKGYGILPKAEQPVQLEISEPPVV